MNNMKHYTRKDSVEADQIAEINGFTIVGVSGAKYNVTEDFFNTRPHIGDYLIDDVENNRFDWIQRATFEATWAEASE